MTVFNRLSPADVQTRPPLEAFQSAAKEGAWVHVSRDGTQWKVLGSGTTPSQRTVAWIEPEADSTSAFVGALGQSFSQGIQASVVRELGLGPAPGKPLSSRTVMQAIDMARTSQQSMEGVDFLTQFTLNAVNNASGFQQACQGLGVAPHQLSAAQRDAIDAAMQQRFAVAAQQGQSPVPMTTAQSWLREEITEARAHG